MLAPWRTASEDQWAGKVRHVIPGSDALNQNFRRYQIDNPKDYSKPIGYVNYQTYWDDEDKPFIGIDMLRTHPEYQGQGVALALLRRLHEDNPQYPINPGFMTGLGHGMEQHLLQKFPEVNEFVLPEDPSYHSEPAQSHYAGIVWSQ